MTYLYYKMTTDFIVRVTFTLTLQLKTEKYPLIGGFSLI